MTQANPLGSDYAQCEALLRGEDLDRWLACLFIPSALRVHVHVLYAFSFEIARIRERVSEPMLGEIRFQWWREILVGERAAEAAAHPVAAALLDTIAKYQLPLDRFSGLIDARLFDLYDEPMPSIAMLESYATATASNLFRLAAEIVAPQPERQGNEKLAVAADHAGIAYAITGLLRALPWHVANGQIYLPLDCLAAHGIDAADVQSVLEADLHADRVSAGLRAALADLRHLAREHLRAFDALMGKTKDDAGSVFLPVRLCEAYLRQMEKPDYDPWRTRIDLPQWRRQWILWRAARAIG
jgi:phytoene synthase